MSLDEPESTDRNTPLGKRAWHVNTGFSTLVPAADLNVADVVSAIDVVEDVISADVEDVIGADVNDYLVEAVNDDDDLVEAVDANSVSVTSVVSTVDADTAANNGVDCAVSVAEVLTAEPVIADAFNSDDVCYPVIHSSFAAKGREAVRSCLIDQSVVQRKRGISIFVPAAKKGDASACVCACCLAYNCLKEGTIV